MARHDFWCPACGQVVVDVVVSAAIGARQHIEPCPRCARTMDWIPGTTAMDVGGVKGAAFKSFDTYDGQNRKVRVSNLRDLRRLERESEQQARNGEGQPIVFRRWAQEDSNRDVHAIHPNFVGGEQPTPAATQRFGSTAQRAAEAPDAAYGPGVSDANATALPE